MTITRHLSEESLLRLAVGTLDPGLAMVARAHLGLCPRCRAAFADYEEIGGLLLEETAPSPASGDGLARVFAVIDAERRTPPPEPRAPAARGPAPIVEGIELPPSAAGLGLEPKRWIAPGIRARRIVVPGSRATRVALIEIAPGGVVPEHAHEGVEMTLVLRGSYCDAAGRSLPGDLVEADEDVTHSPRVDSDVVCVCLVAFTGRSRPSSLLGRIYQSFIDV